MTKAFESIKQGLQEAIAHNQGKAVATRTHRPEAMMLPSYATA